MSKEISKVMRAMTRQRQHNKIDKILHEFKGLKFIKNNKQNSLNTGQILTDSGTAHIHA